MKVWCFVGVVVLVVRRGIIIFLFLCMHMLFNLTLNEMGCQKAFLFICYMVNDTKKSAFLDEVERLKSCDLLTKRVFIDPLRIDT